MKTTRCQAEAPEDETTKTLGLPRFATIAVQRTVVARLPDNRAFYYYGYSIT